MDEMESICKDWEGQKVIKHLVVKRDFALALEKILGMRDRPNMAALQGDMQTAIEVLILRTAERMINQKKGLWGLTSESEKEFYVSRLVGLFQETMHMSDAMAMEIATSVLSPPHRRKPRLSRYHTPGSAAAIMDKELFGIFKELNSVLRMKKKNVQERSQDHSAGDKQQANPCCSEIVTDRSEESQDKLISQDILEGAEPGFVKTEMAQNGRKDVDGEVLGTDESAGAQQIKVQHKKTMAVVIGNKTFTRQIEVYGVGELQKKHLDIAHKASELFNGPANTVGSAHYYYMQQRQMEKAGGQVNL